MHIAETEEIDIKLKQIWYIAYRWYRGGAWHTYQLPTKQQTDIWIVIHCKDVANTTRDKN